jgi:T5SS/PEP-CTERM-associated repeat protein
MARIFSTTGFGFAFNETVGVTAVSGVPMTLSLSFAEDAPVISYSQIFLPEPGFLPDVEIGGDQPLLVAINGLLYGDEIDASVGRLVWSGGTTDVLSLWVSDDEQYIFRLGGDPLPVSASVAEANAFLASVAQPVGLPPAGSGLGPGTDIPLAGLPGWSSVDASDATTYEVAALSFIPGAGDLDPPQGVQASTITFVMDGDTPPDLIYQSLGLEADAGPAGAGATIARAGFSEQPFTILVDGQPITALAEDYQVFFARIVTSGGTTHDVMNLEFMGTGRQYLVSLGGDPLPAATPSAAAAFFDSIASVNPIPAGAGAAGEAIALSGLPGVSTGDYTPAPPPEATGDPAILVFSGHALVYDGDTLSSVTATEFKLALPAGDSVFSYQITGTEDGLPLVEFGGAEIYVGMLDRLALRDGFDQSIARIVADGVAYDVLIFTDRDTDTDYIFQLDGATPLPFGSLAAAEAFRAAVDGPGGSVGAIPAGSPFAPGLDFQLTDSPYLVAVDSDPALITGGNTYEARPSWGVGDGAGTEGSVTVVNGQVLTLDADAAGPFLQVGRGQGALGTITVAGPGSTLEVLSGGNDADGVSTNFGRDGGTGTLRVLDGGQFLIADPDGTSGGPDGDGWEFFQVGRGAGAQGYVDVIGGHLAVTGTGASATFGRDAGGAGAGFVEDGIFRVESTTDDLARLQLGRESGFGRLDLVAGGRALVQAGDGGEAHVEIGRQSGGAAGPGGVLHIDGGPDTGLIVMGGTDSPWVGIDVGRGANGVTGGGLVEVFGGFFGALNRGVRLDDTLNQVGAATSGGAAEIIIGRSGGAAGKGIVRVFDGGEIFASGTDAGRVIIGAGAGAEGDLILDSLSELRVFSQGGDAGVDVGAWGDGTGTLEIRGGSDAQIGGSGGGYLNVGRGQGNTGTLRVEEGSEVLLRGDTNFTAFEIGTNGGAGAATLLSGAQMRFEGVDRFLGIGRGDGDTSGDSDGSLTLNGAGTRLWAAFNTVVGEDAGTGTLRIEAGAAAILGRTDAGTDASFIVGRGAGSDGTLVVSDARLSLQGANNGFEPYMAFGLDGGTGSATITGARGTDPLATHGLIQIGGGVSAFATLDIGRGAGSLGQVTVTGAFFGTQNDGTTFATEAPFGTVDLPGDGGRAVIRIGVQGGEGSLNAGPDSEIFAQGGVDGAALVVGESGGTGSFTLADGELMIEGAESLAFLGIGSGGTGTMALADGAQGRIELLSAGAASGTALIAVGYEGSAGGGPGDGTLIVEGADTELTVVSAGRAGLNVGGATGSGPGEGRVVVRDGANLLFESVGEQEHFIGYRGGEGTLSVTGGQIRAHTTGAGSDNNMWIGAEGGTGNVALDNGGLGISTWNGGAARLRIGVSGDSGGPASGYVVADNGSGLGASVLAGTDGTSQVWIGGGAGGTGIVELRGGSSLGAQEILVGAVQRDADDAGAQGRLTLTGDGSATIGATALTVGYNNGTGTVEVQDGAGLRLGDSGQEIFLGVGIASDVTGNGGLGQLIVEDTASFVLLTGEEVRAVVGAGTGSNGLVRIDGGSLNLSAIGTDAASARLSIGSDGGTGIVLLDGQQFDTGDGTIGRAGSLDVRSQFNTEGDLGTIEIAATGAGSLGVLHVTAGASVDTGSILVGGATSAGGALILDGSAESFLPGPGVPPALNPDLADVRASDGGVLVGASGLVGGRGLIRGDVTITAGDLGVGDVYDRDSGDFGAGQGILAVTGDLAQTGGAAYFDFGTTGDDLLDVGGALSFSGTEFTLVYNGVTPAAGYAVQLAQAAGGITLDAVTLAETSFDGVDDATPALELRGGGTELWFVTGTDLPPPTGQAITMTELGREGTTVTYGLSLNPALVTDGVLGDLALTLDFDADLITYVPDSISAGFTATPGSLTIAGSGLAISDLAAPVVTFEMDLTARPGARSLGFDIEGVTVNGVAMEDQTGADAPRFDYDPAFFTLAGVVDIRAATPGAISPEGTGVTFAASGGGGGGGQSTTTDANGAYSFLIEAGTTGTLEVVRDHAPAPGGPDKALTINDVLALFRMVAGEAGLDVQGYDWIAGDVNRNGTADINDVLSLFRHVAGVPGEPAPEYVFIDAAEDLSGITTGLSLPQPPGTAAIGPMAGDLEISFLGILGGDLNGHI